LSPVESLALRLGGFTPGIFSLSFTIQEWRALE
jgi:hypothetical protein